MIMTLRFKRAVRLGHHDDDYDYSDAMIYVSIIVLSNVFHRKSNFLSNNSTGHDRKAHSVHYN